MNNKLDDLLLHPNTRLQLEYVLRNPPHAIMLTGTAGSGKSTLARALATNILEIDPDKKLEDYPYFLQVTRLKGKQDIAIEQIREVIGTLRLKVPGSKNIQRLVLIDDAHFMSIPAQNALLKALEEPPPGVVFLLSSVSAQNVLPTISSRVQNLIVQQVGLKDSLAFWGDQYNEQAIRSAWRLSGGSVGLLYALLNEDQKHPLKEAVDLARKFLGVKTYERLIILDGLSRNKEELGYFLDALSRILSFLHRTALDNQKTIQADRLFKSRKQLQKSQMALAANVNSKLLGLNLVLNLSI